MGTRWILVAAAAALSLLGAGAVQAQSVADFYKGKTVTVVAPSGTGGSIYKYALLVSNHIGKHIPGTPTTIAESRSGGGGVKAANYVNSAAPTDGTVIAELHPSSLVVPLTRDVEYDPRTFQWLGSVVVRTYVGAVWHTVEADTLEAMRNTEVVFGGSGKGSASYQYPTFLAHVSGAKLKVVTGYKSGGATNLAMERGEVQGRGNYYEGFLATNPDWIRDKKVKFVFTLGPEHPDLAGVPRGSQYTTTERQKKILEVLEAPLNIGQAFYVAAGVPADRVAALRQAFRDMLDDPEFQAEADQLNLFINPRNETQIAAVVESVFKTPKDVVDEMGAILGSN